MNKPKVSIIMGIYNCEQTLEESIKSIINQTYDNWELIMCDDCSIDNTYKIAQKYKDIYPNKIKLLKNDKNMTLGPTLNKCIEYVTGKYIARQDGDDLSERYRLEKQVDFLEKNKDISIVGTNMVSFDESGYHGVHSLGESLGKEYLNFHLSIHHLQQLFQYLLKIDLLSCSYIFLSNFHNYTLELLHLPYA